MTENRCDEIFGKNGELIEYRKKQVLEGAFGIIQRFYEDKPNKMGAIARLFGKRLNQEFKIEHLKLRFRFTTEGLVFWEKEAGCYLLAPYDVFMELLQGKREIKHEEGDCR